MAYVPTGLVFVAELEMAPLNASLLTQPLAVEATSVA